MKTKVMEVITYKKPTSKTKYIIEAALEYKPQFFFRKEKKSFQSRKYGIKIMINNQLLLRSAFSWYLKTLKIKIFLFTFNYAVTTMVSLS